MPDDGQGELLLWFDCLLAFHIRFDRFLGGCFLSVLLMLKDDLLQLGELLRVLNDLVVELWVEFFQLLHVYKG